MTTIRLQTPQQLQRWLDVAESGEEFEYCLASSTPVSKVMVDGVEEVRKDETFKLAARACHGGLVVLFQKKTPYLCAENGATVFSYRARRTNRS